MPFITAKKNTLLASLPHQPHLQKLDQLAKVYEGGILGVIKVSTVNSQLAEIILAGPYTWHDHYPTIETGVKRYINPSSWDIPEDAWEQQPVPTLAPASTPSQPKTPSAPLLPPEVAQLNHFYEGCQRKLSDGRIQAYPDPRAGSGGLPITIGWGSTYYKDGSTIQMGDIITQAEADELYDYICHKDFWAKLQSTIPHWDDMTDLQRSALTSFAYNNGADFYGSPHHRTITHNLKEKDWQAVPSTLMMYRNPGENVEVGLGRRRRAESLVWTGVSPSKACRQAEQEINSAADCERFEQQLKGNPPDIQRNSSNNSVRPPSHTLTSRTSNLGLWLPPLGVDDFTLPVNHYTQIDNTGGEGFRECFMTSCTMLVDYLTKGRLTKERQEKGLAEPEDAYYKYMDGDTTDSSVHIRALRTLGIEAYFSTTSSIKDVESALYLGIPVPIGVQYAPGGGHWVLVNGRGPKGWDILCPNGIRDGASNNWIQRFQLESEAKPDTFSWNLLKQIFVDLGPEAGWTIFVTSVDGISTGVRKGM